MLIPLPRRRGASGVRALVVASSTLAILLICFSIYEFSQTAPPNSETPRESRLPELPTAFPPDMESGPGGEAREITRVGDAVIGKSERVHLSFYSREGTEARFEITVAKWVPVAGAANEFSLVDPDVRFRTNNGHAIRAVAKEGWIEADRRPRGGLDALRGRLSGNVVIEIDRLTRQQREQLPAALRDVVDPAQIVRIEVDEIVFDREYAKVLIDGPVHLLARDAQVRTRNVEIRFDETAGRIEYCRIGSGGRIELRQVSEGLAPELPGVGGDSERPQTLTEWMRSTLRARLAQRETVSEGREKADPASAPPPSTDGVPVFRAESEQRKTPKPGIQYRARFEGAVDVRQMVEESQQSRLLADSLEILRDFADRDRQRVAAPDAGTPTPVPGVDGEGASGSDERLVVTWSDRLVVQMVSTEQTPEDVGVRSRIVASGTPVRVTGADGDAVCETLTFNPDSMEVLLEGSLAAPAQLRSPQQGWVTGPSIYFRQDDETFELRADGPGSVRREGDGTKPPGDGNGVENQSGFVAEFARRLVMKGRIVTSTVIDLQSVLKSPGTGIVSHRRRRVIDSTIFEGRTHVRNADTRLEADDLKADFHTATGAGGSPLLRRVRGSGDVVMTQRNDRMTCERIDVILAPDTNGRPIPQTATAYGDVVAVQGTRTIRAADKLVADFEVVEKPAPPFDAAKAYRAAVAAGLDVAQVDWDVQRREHEAKTVREVSPARFQAFGSVRIVDPEQGVDIAADELACTILRGEEIETAHVRGTEDMPASVRLGALTVIGKEVRVNAAEDWAEVPGEGRMTFLSDKDLDGTKTDEPVLVSITWERDMRYRGALHEARFVGNVHAASGTTTFDCRELLVEFMDTASGDRASEPAPDWWIFQPLIDRSNVTQADSTSGARRRFSKEPAYILATGQAVAVTSEVDGSTGGLQSRARIAGPQLSIDLRSDVSKMLIEGAGTLLLEDFHPVLQSSTERADPVGGLFAVAEGAEPSKTLIQWHDLMWYDFAKATTRFEGDVVLKHFSGDALKRVFPGADAASGPGRATYLTCGVLTVDFMTPDRASQRTGAGMGGLSAGRLRGFQAHDNVVLKDPPTGLLLLTASRAVYDRDRHLLAIHGSPRERARIVRQRTGQLPTDISARRFYYDTATGRIESSAPLLRGR